MTKSWIKPVCVGLALLAAPVWADDRTRILTIDHYVGARSGVPAIAGQISEIYLRERVQAGSALRPGARDGQENVVLFVHGAGTPAEVAFDVPYTDYSWMAYLAAAGYDVFAVDMTGYGRSTRPAAMNDPCNLSPEQARQFAPSCKPAAPGALTTIASDWDDISAAVDYITTLRHVSRVNLIGWSLGGPRAGGWTARHPEKVAKLILLAPAYNRATKAEPPPPAKGAAFNTQSHAEFTANWDRQAPCMGQYDPVAADAVWSALLASDPVGATWGPGARRAPQTSVWGWTTEMVKKMTVPTLMVSGVHDGQVNPDRVREFYADIGGDKVFVDLACSSHNAMWEKNHLLLFRASLEWLRSGTVNGQKNTMLRLGY